MEEQRSAWFEDVKGYYGNPYTKEDVKVFVVAAMITAEEYEVIVGEAYVA